MTEYEEQINALIPEASRLATEKLRKSKKDRFILRPGADGKPFKWCRWSEFFHESMCKLARDAGLRS